MNIKKLAILLFIAVFGTHALAVWGKWYFMYPWIDIPLHFAGGGMVALFALVFIASRQRLFPRESGCILVRTIFVLGCTALVGIGWEFFEFGYDALFKPTQSVIAQIGSADTIGDLFFDLLGGAVVAAGMAAHLLRKPRC